MPLSDITIRNAKPAEKPYKIYDGSGLYIKITPFGGKVCRLKYRYAGKEKLHALRKYPEDLYPTQLGIL